MSTPVPTEEGYVPFRGYRIWYRVVGSAAEPGKLPLICLHGGPGFTWDSFEPLEAMAVTGRQLVFYDQLVCGDSDVPKDPSIYTVGLYLDGVAVVRRALGLDRVHVFGHSWGGMPAMAYALTQPEGLASLILAGGGPSLRRRVSFRPRVDVPRHPLNLDPAPPY